MFPMTTREGGGATSAPGVCKVPAPPGPPVPQPFVNKASFAQADPGTCSEKVRVGGKAVVTVASVVPMTSGDEAGTLGGVTSNTSMDRARLAEGSKKVLVEGSPVGFQTCPVDANGSNANAKGLHDAASQSKVTVGG
ncbi:MAG: DUF4150 domain-containing protein [Deltaproteobacteria bacterium]|nr:DUF4150 domain-containing protein [Deltaproteobacteria bacterium]